MLLNNYIHPTLLIAIDDVKESNEKLRSVMQQTQVFKDMYTFDVSAQIGKETAGLDSIDASAVAERESQLIDHQKALAAQGEQALTSYNDNVLAIGNSDLLDNMRRLPIIFYDAIIPAHVNEVNSTTTRSVDWLGDEPVVYEGSNYVTVSITFKNDLSAASTIADTFMMLADLLYKKVETKPGDTSDGLSRQIGYRMSARASFISTTFTMYEGFLVAINRGMIKGQDREVITLTFQKSAPKPKQPKPEELPAIQGKLEVGSDAPISGGIVK